MDRVSQSRGESQAQKEDQNRAPETGGGSGHTPAYRALALPPAGVGAPSLSPHSALRLQRLVGNQALRRLLGPAGTPLHSGGLPAPDSGTTVQRKVMIQQEPLPLLRSPYRRKRRSGKSTLGQGERNVRQMMRDGKVRYFESKSELYQYAEEQTDRIGYFEDTWLRLPDELTVVGENHDKVPNALSLVTATGTRKFMHEGYTEQPEDSEGAKELTAGLDERAQVMNAKVGVSSLKRAEHQSEDFYPKLMRGLTGITKMGAMCRINGTAAEASLLRLAVLDVRRILEADPEESQGLFQTYQANTKLFDDTAEFVRSGKIFDSPLSVEMERVRSTSLFDDFLEDFDLYAYQEIARQQKRMPAADKLAFEAEYDPSIGNYGSAAMMKAEKARDLSMFQHIKAARAKGYLLYGLGNLHHLRMASLLDREGIKHTTVEELFAEQKSLHPQR